jgi:hypothetical protein
MENNEINAGKTYYCISSTIKDYQGDDSMMTLEAIQPYNWRIDCRPETWKLLPIDTLWEFYEVVKDGNYAPAQRGIEAKHVHPSKIECILTRMADIIEEKNELDKTYKQLVRHIDTVDIRKAL